jgi:hypothetical protein
MGGTPDSPNQSVGTDQFRQFIRPSLSVGHPRLTQQFRPSLSVGHPRLTQPMGGPSVHRLWAIAHRNIKHTTTKCTILELKHTTTTRAQMGDRPQGLHPIILAVMHPLPHPTPPWRAIIAHRNTSQTLLPHLTHIIHHLDMVRAVGAAPIDWRAPACPPPTGIACRDEVNPWRIGAAAMLNVTMMWLTGWL